MKKNTNQNKKSHKKLWIILAMTAVVVIGLIAWGISAIKNMTKSMTAAMTQNTAVAETGSIEVITEGSGVVETADSITKNTEYTVRLNQLYKKNGEAVKAGEVIGEFDGTALDESIAALETHLETVDSQLKNTDKNSSTTVNTPASGRVKRIFAAEGDSVKMVQLEQPGLAEISADGRLKVNFDTNTPCTLGQHVIVVYGEERIKGEVESVKGTAITAVFSDSENYVLDTQVTILNQDEIAIGTGKVESSCPIYITADSGSIKSISVKENDKVSAGSSIFKLTDMDYSAHYLTLLEQRQQLLQQLETAKKYAQGYVLTAEKDCIVSELTAKVGDILPAGTLFCKLMDTSAYQATFAIDEMDIHGIEKGQKVLVSVDAVEGSTYEGTVSNISLAGTNENGVASYGVSVALKDASGLLPGMSANGKITVGMNEQALLVPIDAVQTIEGKKTVTVVKKDGKTEAREVTLGLVNNEKAEVLKGISKGDKVQIVIKLSDIYSQMGIDVEETGME
ncbi:MAG: HlyD family efflux transporter periplasmic adaptor subunit [Lachnospiraceae bacterium]